MMLSTVSSNGLGDGAAGFCARRSCGASRDSAQNTMAADRRRLVFIIVAAVGCSEFPLPMGEGKGEGLASNRKPSSPALLPKGEGRIKDRIRVCWKSA